MEVDIMIDIRNLIIDFYEKKSPTKTMFMFPDIYKGIKSPYTKKGLTTPFKRKEVKNVIDDMITNQEAVYWSSGSTTYIKLNKPIDDLRQGCLEEKLE